MNTSKKIIKRVENDLKPHNVETIKNILEIYKTSNKCCAIQATGTGKTFLILRLLEIYNDEGKSAVIFAPNREIIKQTKKRMKKFGLNNAIFYTYHKLARMTDKEITTIETDLIVCDELHRTGAKTWGQKFEMLVETHPESKVFGVTATPLRCMDGRDMAEEYFDGNKACDISLAEALVREIIPVMPLYVSALYTFEEEYQNMSDKIEKGNNSVEEKIELQKELLAAKQQLEKANGIPDIIKKYITNYDGKYLVFCRNKEHLYEMKDTVIGWFRESGYDGKIYDYPYYSNCNEVKDNLKSFENNKEQGIKLLFVIDKLNEGLHLDDVNGCILLRTTTSNIIYYQQIGRAIDAGSKEKRIILDLVSNFNSIKSFSLKRDLDENIIRRRNGEFSHGNSDDNFDIDKFSVVDLVQPCIDVFNRIDSCIMGEYYTEEEDNILREYYPKIGLKVLDMLKRRDARSVYSRASKLGIPITNSEWTEEEIESLKEYYPKIGMKSKKYLYGKTNKDIIDKVHELDLMRIKPWTNEEIELLKKYYPSMGTKCVIYFPNRNKDNIRIKAQDIGLKIRNKWTDEEIELLKEKYPILGTKCIKFFPSRTVPQIVSRANSLGLKKLENPSGKSKYKFVRYSNRDDVYIVGFTVNGERLYFGSFKNEDEAGMVALEKAKEYGKI